MKVIDSPSHFYCHLTPSSCLDSEQSLCHSLVFSSDSHDQISISHVHTSSLVNMNMTKEGKDDSNR